MNYSGSAIAYFEEIIAKSRVAEELMGFSGKVFGTFCNFVPEELIYALNGFPVRLCSGDIELAKMGEEIFPRDVCSLVKASVGMALSNHPLFKRVDMLIVPTPCDAKKKLCGVLEPYKQVHILQLPPSKSDDDARRFWIEQIWRLKRRLELVTGQKLTRKGLMDAIAMLNRRQKAFARLFKLRKLFPSVISGREALTVTVASFYDDVERWVKNVHHLCEERENRYVANQFICDEFAPRLLITGAPLIYPNFKLVNIIESTGAVVAIDDLCSGTQRLYQPTVVRDLSIKAMIEAIAERTLLPSICPCFVESAEKLNRLNQLIEEFHIDGVIYHNLRICPLFDIDSVLVYSELKKRHIPCLVLLTDYTYEDVNQIRNRVEAFVEMLISRATSLKESK